MLLLASASPRRAELLRAAGIDFDVLAVNLDETPIKGEAPEAHVRRLAEEKARAAFAERPDATILAADTEVVFGERVLGKPKDAADAAAMLRALSGQAHEVITGVALIQAGMERRRAPITCVVGTATTRVWVSALTDDEIAWYVASGEPMDKAGAYAIQGLASRFVDRIEGSYSNVVGLPVALVYRLLQELPENRRSGAVSREGRG